MRWSSLVGILAIVVAACGGGETGGNRIRTTEDVEARVVDDEVVRVATLVVADLGRVGGFDAVLFAFERGYSIDQLLSVGSDGRTLEGVGVITGPAGVADPEVGSLGLIELPNGPNAMGAPVGLLAVYRSSGIVTGERAGAGVLDGESLLLNLWQEPAPDLFDIESLRTAAQTLADKGLAPAEVYDTITGEAVGLILTWAVNGYSGEQIIETLAFGGHHTFVPGRRGINYCMLLVVGDEPLVPTSEPLRNPACLDHLADSYGDPQSASATTTTTSEATTGDSDVTVFDGTYTGDVILGPDTDVSWAMAWEMTSASSTVMIIDGTVEGTATTTVVFTEGFDENLIPCSGGEGCAVETQSVLQTMPFNGTIDERGVIVGNGTSDAVYELISCVSDPEDLCVGAQPTTSAGAFPITVEGVVEADGTLTFALIWRGDSIRYLGEAAR